MLRRERKFQVTIVVVSPHFDDAVLSCWTVIDGSESVEVVTVFTAGPAPGIVTGWDRDTGVDSATRMIQREVENRAALALAGRSATNLGFLETQYGAGGLDGSALADHLRDADVVYAPAGIATRASQVNGEHGVVRDACLSVRPDVVLYADQPYCHYRADTELPAGMSIGLTRKVVVLSAEQRDRKAEAIRCYTGELTKLVNIFGLALTDPDQLQHEIFWTPA